MIFNDSCKIKRFPGKMIILLSFLVPCFLHAATTRILERTQVQEAEPAALEAEAGIFKSIGLGLALSLAQCELDTECQVRVSETELDRLLHTINDRINGLVIRLESGDTEIETALLMYAAQRDNYLLYREKLAELAPEPEDAPDDTFGQDEGEIDMSIFEDVGESEPGEEDLFIDDFDPGAN